MINVDMLKARLKHSQSKLPALLFFLAMVTAPASLPAAEICRNNMFSDLKTEFIQNLADKLAPIPVVFAACKLSPVHIGQTYAVLVTPKEQSCRNECDYNLYFLLADNSGNTITRLYKKENALRASATMIDNIALDTGLYQLSPSVRAVGIRIDKNKTEQPFQTSANTLYLFVEEGKTFRPLFHNGSDRDSTKLSALFMKQTEKSQIDKSCDLYQSEKSRTIELGSYHNGFRDLIIKSHIIDTVGQQDRNGCAQQTIAITTGQTVIAYDGDCYPLPNWLSP